MVKNENEHFTAKSKAYQSIRPDYPEEIYKWLSGQTNNNIALDICTGNGQVCKGISKYFNKVYGIDINSEQIKNAYQNNNIEYHIGTLESFIKDKHIEENSIDVITIAQALHFLDIDNFFYKSKSILKSNGIIACWVYVYPTCENNEITNLLDFCYNNILNEYWEDFRKIANNKYKNINFPFEELHIPNEYKFIEKIWNKTQLLEFMNTWTAVSKALQITGKNPIESIMDKLNNIWIDETYKFTFELYFRCGRK